VGALAVDGAGLLHHGRPGSDDTYVFRNELRL
jgi:hypothetical protein